MTRVTHICIFFCLLMTFQVSAQGDRDKIEAMRYQFISKRLELSSGESEKFWPLYNEYNDKVKAIKKNLRQSYKRKTENMGDKEADELVVLEIQSKQAEADLFKTYSEKIKAVIGSTKLVKLHLAEEAFKREMINSIKEKGD